MKINERRKIMILKLFQWKKNITIERKMSTHSSQNTTAFYNVFDLTEFLLYLNELMLRLQWIRNVCIPHVT